MFEAGLKTIDLYNEILDNPEYYSKDGVHPNPDGYSVMEGVIMPILKKYIR